MIPDSFIERLKDVSDIEQVISSYVSLKRRGGRLMGLCPFHSEKTPSFTVFPDEPHYYCFGCGSGGDVITFIRNIEHLEYIEAIRFLAQRAGLHVPEDAEDDRSARQKARILEINREAARFYHRNLISEPGKAALAYLMGRGLTAKTIKRFGLGYSPPGWDGLKNYLGEKGFSREDMAAAELVRFKQNGGSFDMFRGRVMFPIIDLRGNVIAFGGRAMDDNGPKYLNSPDTPVFKKSRNLFALNFAKAAKSDTLVLGEGYMDVIAMHQAGFENAVATLGTSLTEEQANLISRYARRCVIAYDSDGAGKAAAKRAINLFSRLDVAVSVAELSGAKDPDEYIRKFGAVRFKNLLEASRGAVSFEIDQLKRNRDMESPEDAVAFLKDFIGYIAQIDNELERGVHIASVARELDMDKRGIVSGVEAARQKKFAQRKKKETHNLLNAVQDNGRTRTKPRPNTALSAEELLLALLLRNPDAHIKIRENLSPQDFLNGENRAVFEALLRRLSEGAPTEPAYLSQELDPGAMARVARLLARARELELSPAQAGEYINVIKAKKEHRSWDEVREMPQDGEEYRRYIASIQAQKK